MKEFLSRKDYPSKLLVFGEYAVLSGGRALAIPFDKYSGHWQLHSGHKPPTDWEQLIRFLLTQEFSPYCVFEKDKFWEDVSKGLYFQSNIPLGYGLGSSGALTAAIFDAYFTTIGELEIKCVKESLATIESFFHGSSSGMDPLTSYSGQSILFDSKNIELIKIYSGDKIYQNWFLIDSGRPRSTAQMVKSFKNLLTQNPLNGILYEKMCVQNEMAINALLRCDQDLLQSAISELSRIQLTLFEPFNPEHINSMWKKGLSTDSYYMKLCGAGGGGFYFLIKNHADKHNFDGEIAINK